MLAGYADGELKLVRINNVTSANRSASFMFSCSEIDYFKVMLLDKLNGIKPLAKCMVITDVPDAEF